MAYFQENAEPIVFQIHLQIVHRGEAELRTTCDTTQTLQKTLVEKTTFSELKLSYVNKKTTRGPARALFLVLTNLLYSCGTKTIISKTGLVLSLTFFFKLED